MNAFIAAVLQTRIRDNLSGFFAIRPSASDRSLRDDVFHGYGGLLLSALLWWAERFGYRVLEESGRVPVARRRRQQDAAAAHLAAVRMERAAFPLLGTRDRPSTPGQSRPSPATNRTDVDRD
jgi:hypothetical protein